MRFSASSALALVAATLPALADAGSGQAPAQSEEIERVVMHPPYAEAYMCSEHWAGQLPYMGDALGTDCLITRLVETPTGGAFSSTHEGDGLENEDWFGYGQPVLAPFDGEVARVATNPKTNKPGSLGNPPASVIVFKRSDGVMALYAHIDEPMVAVGDAVAAGQQVARVGNNGYSRTPHVHIGVWQDEQPLQVIWDLNGYADVMARHRASEGRASD